eukprot:9182007-Alexandrium_andersonii.AAC.1
MGTIVACPAHRPARPLETQRLCNTPVRKHRPRHQFLRARRHAFHGFAQGRARATRTLATAR